MSDAYYAAIFEQDFGPSWQVRWGLPSTQFQQTVDQFVKQGYRMVNVSGYGVNNQALYAAIFEQRAGPAWQVRWGLPPAQLQQTVDQFVKQGYRPMSVSGYTVNNQALYVAFFEQDFGPSWQVRWGLTPDRFQQTVDQFVKQGYRLVNISGYGVNSQALYAAIFEQRAGPAWQVRWGLTSDRFQQVVDQFVKQGYRLVNVSGYGVADQTPFAAIIGIGQTFYAAIFEQRSGTTWQVRWGLTSAQLQQTMDQFVKQGYRLVNVSGYSR
jgi:putative SOS response-associated peptidase YedK